MKPFQKISILLLATYFMVACSPLKEFKTIPVYKGDNNFNFSSPQPEAEKKNIFILAYNEGTEIFDFIAPYYLFNLTGKANVLVIAPRKEPIALMKGFHTYPHYTMKEIDSMQVVPDAMVIPNFSAMDKEKQDSVMVNWIRRKYSESVKLLAVCAGSITAAATGLYDGKEMTTHASELQWNREHFSRPVWTEGLSFTRNGNLYSTAGVSNATEGSLALIRDFFGEETMQEVMQKVHYPHSTLKTGHQNLPVSSKHKIGFLKKILFEKDKHIGVLLEDNIDEFALAAILDAYHRTMPASLKTYTINRSFVTGRFGLKIIPSGDANHAKKVDELHVLSSPSGNNLSGFFTSSPELVHYDLTRKAYIFDVCLEKIRKDHGSRFQEGVKRLLDYN